MNHDSPPAGPAMSFEQAYYEADSFWAGDALTDSGNRSRVELTAAVVPRDVRSLLDAGCGNGVFGIALAAARPDIALVGMDRSAAALKYAPFETIQGSLESIPFPDGSFDCVSCLQVIEHLPLGVYEVALRELVRVSRRYVIVGVPYKEDLEKDTTVCPACKTRFNIDLHLRTYDDAKIANLFTEHGGRMTRIEFPARRLRLKYVNEVLGYLRRDRTPQGFLSPICPVCGYSEGDLAAAPVVDTSVPGPAGQGSGLRATAKRLARSIGKIWPREEVFGYWAIALYEFPDRETPVAAQEQGGG
ncbi:hypothetical protein AMEJIAPC_02981 [Caulobacter sp. NIBR1757]|nr:hypothetical protein AMEJIAPC_02981 [Caulobacter sp. NIBR1757]